MRKYYGLGINDYPGTEGDLRGCINDVILGRNASYRRGYGRENLTLFTDKAATVDSFRQTLVEIANTKWDKEGCFVVHYAGHGTYLPDISGDEKDKIDEAIVFHDFETAGLFLDDEFHTLMEAIPDRVRGIFIMDCCFSGGVTRFKGRYPGGLVSNATTYRNRFLRLPPPLASRFIEGEIPYPNTPIAAPSESKNRYKLKIPRRFVVFNAASEDEPAADAYLHNANGGKGAHHGAFTYSLFEALEENNYDITYTDLLAATTRKLRERGFTQTPCLEGDPITLEKKWAG